MDEEILILSDEGNISTFLWHCYSTEKYTDVEFVYKEHVYDSTCKKILAHGLVLSMWSPYFADKLYGLDTELSRVFHLNDENPDAFIDMIRFMYGMNPSMESPKSVYEIYKVAVKYQVKKLVYMCEKYFKEIKPSVSNVFDALKVASCLENSTLKTGCLSLIRDKTEEILKSHVDNTVSPHVIDIILGEKEMSLVSEYDLLLWLFTWAKNEYVRESKYSSPREVVQDYFPKLDFLSLTSEEFVKIFKKHEGIFKETEAFSILMNIAIFESWPMPNWFSGQVKMRKYSGHHTKRKSN